MDLFVDQIDIYLIYQYIHTDFRKLFFLMNIFITIIAFAIVYYIYSVMHSDKRSIIGLNVLS